MTYWFTWNICQPIDFMDESMVDGSLASSWFRSHNNSRRSTALLATQRETLWRRHLFCPMLRRGSSPAVRPTNAGHPPLEPRPVQTDCSLRGVGVVVATSSESQGLSMIQRIILLVVEKVPFFLEPNRVVDRCSSVASRNYANHFYIYSIYDLLIYMEHLSTYWFHGRVDGRWFTGIVLISIAQ